MTDMSIALQEVKVRALKCAWTTACQKHNHYETWYTLAAMQDARRELVAAEDELLAMVEAERYDPTIAKNSRAFDADQTEAYELAHPGACM
jgi:hypothetical protein